MEEKKALIVKPPSWFTAQLFCFMMLLVWKCYGLFEYFSGQWCDVIGRMPVLNVVISAIIDVLAYAFALTAIYKALQRRSYSIMMLKFSAFYILLPLIFQSLSNIGAIHPFLQMSYVIPILFCSIFLCYLFMSKRLKLYIPSSERTFGRYGGMALCIYSIAIGNFTYSAVGPLYKMYNSRVIDPQEISLRNGEITDGIVLFKPLATWTMDSIIKPTNGAYTYVFHTGDDSRILAIACNGEECETRVDYYAILSQYYEAAALPDTLSMKEVTYNDTIINGDRYYSTTYEIVESETDGAYWTFSALVSKKYYKIMTLSYLEKGDYGNSIKESVEFMDGVEFHLEKLPTMQE